MNKITNEANNLANQCTINDLPVEIYEMIFNCLDLEELSKLKFINRKFYYIVKSYRIQEINFFNYSNIKDSWFFDYKPIHPTNSIHLSRISILSSNYLNLNHLKRIKIYYTEYDNNFDLEILNKFMQINHLELIIQDFKEWSKTIKLKLPQLKNLFINIKPY